MLVEFKVRNFASIKEEQVISLVANSDNTLNENCINLNKIRLLKSAVIYGPNASGKSNILKAILTMQSMVTKSAIISPNVGLPTTSFKLNKNFLDNPSCFEVIFIIEDVRYQYGFTTTNKRIHDEWLFAFPQNRAQRWFERTYDSETGKTQFKWSSYFKGDRKKLEEMTRNDSLYLSVGAQFNNEQLTKIYDWFSFYLRVVIDSEYIKGVTAELIHSLGDKDKNFKNTVIDLLKKADLGIFDISIKKEEVKKPEFPSNIPQRIKDEILLGSERNAYKVGFYHECDEKQKPVLEWYEESKGTQQFFQYIGPWLDSLWSGGVVIIDELDRSLHPFLTRALIELFHDPKVNRNGAQLVFNTHNTSFLDSELFRRDQIWFTEKDNEGATNLYPLSDYKPRRDEALQKGYLSGRYGAVPILEEFGIIGQ